MITCLKCRQQYSEANHSCLESMTLEQFYALSDDALAVHLEDAVEPCGVRRLLSRGETCAKPKGHEGMHDWW